MHGKRLFAVMLTVVLCLAGCGSIPQRDIAYVQTETQEQFIAITEPAPKPEHEPESQPEPEPTPEPEPEPDPETAVPASGSQTEAAGLLHSPEDIALTDTTGMERQYTFTYDGQVYEAVYTKDNWHITDSCQIGNYEDIIIICEALSAAHPIHSADYSGWRTAEDLAYEWMQHNLAYKLLSMDSEWREHAKDVDLDPADQGKTLYEMYLDRTQ